MGSSFVEKYSVVVPGVLSIVSVDRGTCNDGGGGGGCCGGCCGGVEGAVHPDKWLGNHPELSKEGNVCAALGSHFGRASISPVIAATGIVGEVVVVGRGPRSDGSSTWVMAWDPAVCAVLSKRELEFGIWSNREEERVLWLAPSPRQQTCRRRMEGRVPWRDRRKRRNAVCSVNGALVFALAEKVWRRWFKRSTSSGKPSCSNWDFMVSMRLWIFSSVHSLGKYSCLLGV